MRNIKNTITKILDEKKTFLVVELGIILVVAFFLFCAKSESIIIYYDQYPDNMRTQIFFDIGAGYSEEFSILCSAQNETKMMIPREYIPSLKKIRIDFSDKEGMLSIKKIKICKNGLNILSFNAKEIVDLFDTTDEIDYNIDHNRLLINNLSIDGKCYFNDTFVRKTKNIYDSIQLKELMIAFFFVSAISLFFHFRDNIYIWVSAFSQRRRFAFVLSLFIFGLLWLYREYILGDIVFVFGGVAGDSVTQSYPNLYRWAYLIENGKTLFGFDFTRGYGAARAIYAINFFDWMILFGTKYLAYLMGINQILKIVLSFVLFYVYLRLLKRKEVVCYIGAVSYALCGHMIMRQFWKSYSNEVVLSALLLVALEYSISKKKHMLLPVAVLLYCITMGEYNSVFGFGLVIGYTLFRYLDLYDVDFHGLIKTILYNIVAYLIAILGGFIYLFQPLLISLNSERAKGGVSSFDFRELIRLQDINNIKIGIMRTVSEALEGREEMFQLIVHDNILEGPTFYCGILIILFVPFAIHNLKGKRKLLAWVVTIFAASYIVFPNLRHMANGFGAYTYKLSSFWITILLLYYGTMGMQCWIEEEKALPHFFMYGFQMLVIIISLLLVSQEKECISFDYQQLAITIGIIILLNITMIFRDKMSPYSIIYMLIMLTCIDLFSNAYVFADSGIALTKDQIENRYEDSGIDYIKGIENDKFYRIENKDNRSQENLGLVLDYNGFVDYTGGTSMNDNLHRFLEAMKIARIQPSSNHYMTGLNNANELYSILSAKYIITSQPAIDNDYGLQLLTEIDGEKIYENRNVLSIGSCYESYLTEEDMSQLDTQERRIALLDSCVLDADSAAAVANISNSEWRKYKTDVEGDEHAYEYDADLHKIMFDEISADKVVQLTFDMEARTNNLGALSYGSAEENLGSVLVECKGVRSSQSFVFTGNNISWFQCSYDIENIKLTIYDREAYYEKTDQYLQDRKNSEFNCTSFFSNNIAGTVNSDKDAVLFFSIPYNKGWNIYIDGEKAELLKVNYGFIGAYLEAGNHDIVLKYQIPYIKLSLIVSMMGIVLIIIWGIYWNKKERQIENSATRAVYDDSLFADRNK